MKQSNVWFCADVAAILIVGMTVNSRLAVQETVVANDGAHPLLGTMLLDGHDLAICGHQQFLRPGESLLSHLNPPLSNAVVCEPCCIAINSDIHPALIVDDVVDAIALGCQSRRRRGQAHNVAILTLSAKNLSRRKLTVHTCCCSSTAY